MTDTIVDPMALEDAVTLPTYAKPPVALVRGAGTTVWDTEGRAYLDFYGGHCVAMLGHCPPRVVKAIQEQAATLLFYSNAMYSPVRARAAHALTARRDGCWRVADDAGRDDAAGSVELTADDDVAVAVCRQSIHRSVGGRERPEHHPRCSVPLRQPRLQHARISSGIEIPIRTDSQRPHSVQGVLRRADG